ncbi:MAG: pyruvate ferredoxin oxidoreductase [Desulfobacterales bacterium]|nr:pyruvate ferredoxin oxidoreductase [Desulfobacterales bacterium]MCP4162559.1 pyruvate ferredoxin oxidoreductase [Deltaproteobacteria bacterium]
MNEKVMEGSHAISEAVRLCNVGVVSGFPITPQTHIIEAIAEHCSDGTMKAKYINVESEHSAMAAIVGASSAGTRAFTATSSHGLALMHELLHWAAGARLPIVMGEVNRALGPGWNIWTDQTDSLSQRDTGWIQLYCEDGQEALDTVIFGFRLAELVNLPVMVIIDAFLVSHTYEAVSVPTQDEVNEFLPAFNPRIKLDLENPQALNQMASPQYYMEMRKSMQLAMETVEDIYDEVEDEFHDTWGRRYGSVEGINLDADVVFVTSGTATTTCRLAIKDLTDKGESVGMLKIKMFRPFPAKGIQNALKNAGKVAVVDRNFSFGAGGIFAQEVKSSLCNLKDAPVVFNFIAGLGGRDITTDTFFEMYEKVNANDIPQTESEWIGINEQELK